MQNGDVIFKQYTPVSVNLICADNSHKGIRQSNLLSVVYGHCQALHRLLDFTAGINGHMCLPSVYITGYDSHCV